MSTTDDLVYEYKRQHSWYEQFTQRITELCESLLKAKHVKFHLEKRTKTVESFQEKLNRPTKSYNHLNEITDLSALRVIVSYQKDLPQVIQLFRDEFQVDETKSVDKSKDLAPDQFGYHGVHLIVQISNKRKGLIEWEPFSGLQAEIQIRTILQHAWNVASHSLDYKSSDGVPEQFRRKLFRLSALLEEADEGLSRLYEEHQKLVTKVQEDLSEDVLDIEINKVALDEYLKKTGIIEAIVADAKKIGFTINEENLNNLPLLWICKEVNIRKISQLDEILKEIVTKTIDYFTDLKNEIDVTWNMNLAFLVQLLLLMKFSEKFTVDVLVEQGWDINIATSILKIAQEHNKQL